CCSTWLRELNPVSLSLAKDQRLSLNPSQISGGCGRLLCCLKYEHEFYVAARKRFPKEGKAVRTSRGAERVVAVDIFRERVSLRSEEHGPRIVLLADLKEEIAAAAAEGPVAAAGEAPTTEAPATEAPATEAPRGTEERPPRRERRRKKGRERPAAADAAPRPRAPNPEARSAEPDGTEPSPDPGKDHPRKRRRRRRGRRRGPDAPPSTPES
ncbi:MAG: regulatory iron-sulfur-containing complex subunit RicT, partial [Gemmatimonadales bacterium]